MARPRLGESESKRLQMVITEDELKAIEDWQFANRMPSKSEAIRRLCKIGLFVETELEQVVDLATECLEGMTDQFRDSIGEMRIILDEEASDVQFGQGEIRDVLDAGTDRTLDAMEAMEGLHRMIVTLYNAIAPFAEASTLAKGTEESQKRIDEANAATERAIEKRQEREENQYLSLIVTNRTPEEDAIYQAIPEDEKDAYLERQIESLKVEEAEDLEAFAERYNIPPPFWEKAGWATRLRQRVKKEPGNE